MSQMSRRNRISINMVYMMTSQVIELSDQERTSDLKTKPKRLGTSSNLV